MLFKLHFLLGCCVVTSGFCVGCVLRVTLLPVGVPRLRAPPCVTPGNGMESTAASWSTTLPVSGTGAPMQTSHLLYHSAFCLKNIGWDHTAPQHPWKRCEKEPVFTLNNHENGVTERTDGSTRQLTFGAKPDSILLDSSSSGTASKCFLFQN